MSELGLADIVKSGVAARIKWLGVADETAKIVPVESISRESTTVTILKNHTARCIVPNSMFGVLSVSVAYPKEKTSVEATRIKGRHWELDGALDHRRAEACDIFDAEYSRQEVALACSAIVSAWVDGSVEVFSQ